MKQGQVIAAAAALVFAVSAVHAQTSVRVRGTITGLEGRVLSVKSRDGNDLKLELADGLTVAVATAVRFEDIKLGDLVGATTRPGADGRPVALEVRYLASTVSTGQSTSDLQPGSTMTNANVVSSVVGTGSRELTLQYKDGQHTFAVPEGTPLVRAVPGTRTDLAVGEYVFVAAQAASDGSLTAARIQVSKNGVKPPQ